MPNTTDTTNTITETEATTENTTTEATETTATETTEATTTTTTETGEATRASTEATATAGTNRGEIIEVEWENVKHIYEFRQKLQDMEQYFASMCLKFEKDKANIMSQITFGQNDLYTMAEQLQKSHNVDTTLTYELKLPANTGEKGYFLRKEQFTQVAALTIS